MAMTAVDMQNVSKKYGSTVALDSLTLSIPEGQITGVLGPNGAGKSTFFKTLVGLTRPNQGDITVLGQKPSWKVNRQVAYLGDQCRWYEFQTVLQAVDYAAAVFPNFDKDKAQELVASLGLTNDATVGSLSKGQKARLQLILCLARDVQLLLLDEPFSGIDLVSREKIIEGIIQTFSNNKQTIIISTHEIHQAESLFDQVIFMDQGRVIMAGEVETLRQERGSIEAIYRGLFQ